jgi:hypothetical protein
MPARWNRDTGRYGLRRLREVPESAARAIRRGAA